MWQKIRNRYSGYKCANCRDGIARGDMIWHNAGAPYGAKTRCINCGAGDAVGAIVGQAGLALGAVAPSPVAPSPVASDDLAGLLAGAIQGRLQFPSASINRDEVVSIVVDEVARAIENIPARRVEISVNAAPVVDITGQHKTLQDLITVLACKSPHAWLYGPAGSGKTTAVEKAASVLGLRFIPFSVGEQTSYTQIFGYMSATGGYVTTLFRDAYENGGLFLLDEIDACNANVLTAINAALANGYCSFPDTVVKRHASFKCVAAGNTYGRGANRLYVGRAQIDAATLDRFAFIFWDYDEELERPLAGNHPDWHDYVLSVRRAVEKLGIRHIVSPRATIFGAELLDAGMPRDKIENMVIWKGLDEDAKNKIKAAL